MCSFSCSKSLKPRCTLCLLYTSTGTSLGTRGRWLLYWMGRVCGIPNYPNEYHLTLQNEKAFFSLSLIFLDVQTMNFNISIYSCDDHHNQNTELFFYHPQRTPWCYLSLSFTFSTFWPFHLTCGILVPQPETKPTPPEVETWLLGHWTTREIPRCYLFTVTSTIP